MPPAWTDPCNGHFTHDLSRGKCPIEIAASRAPQPDDGSNGSHPTKGRTQQQVETFDLLLNATTPCGRDGISGWADGSAGTQRIEACSRLPAARATEHEVRIQQQCEGGGLKGGALLLNASSDHRTTTATATHTPLPPSPLPLPLRCHHPVTTIPPPPGVPDARLTTGVGTTVPATAVMRDALHRTNHSQYRRHRCHHSSPRHRRRRSPSRRSPSLQDDSTGWNTRP